MLQTLHPGVHVQRITREPPASARIDVAAFVGIAPRGPVGRVEVLNGWPDFVATFGDFQTNAYLAYAVRGFFDNGGQRCHILRVAAAPVETETAGAQPADGSASALDTADDVVAGSLATLVQVSMALTSGAQPADRRSSVLVGTAGFMPGNRALLSQDGAPPTVIEIAEVDGGASTVHWTRPIPAGFDLTQPVTVTSTASDERLVAGVAGTTVSWTRPLDSRFDLDAPIKIGFGAAVSGGVAYDEAGRPLLSIEAANPGRWGNLLSVRVTTRFASDYGSRPRSTPDANRQISVDRVDGLAPGAVVELDQDGASTLRTVVETVHASNRLVIVADATDIVFDLVGAADGTKPIRLRRLSATLSVREAGRLVETFEDIDLPAPSKPDDSPVNAQSRLIRIALLPGSARRWLDMASPLLDRGEVRLTGGRDGIAMLAARDFVGVVGRPASGLALFEDRPEPAAIAMPDIMLPPMSARETLPEDPPEPDPCAMCPEPGAHPLPWAGDVLIEATPGFDRATVEAIQQSLVEHCEARGDRVAVLDPIRDASGGCPDWPDLIRWRQRFDSSYAVAYHPWLDVTDPLDRTARFTHRIPPSGHAMGQFALSDRDPGRAAPANRQLGFAVATACATDDTRHAMLNERGLNAITVRPGRGLRIMGARTLSSDADWTQLVVRRLFIRLKRLFRRELAWAVFEPADARLEKAVIATLESLLEIEWQAGRLRGARAEDAFQVAIDRESGSVDNGELVVVVAVAPSLPAEFVLLRLTFTLDALNLAELTARGGWPS